MTVNINNTPFELRECIEVYSIEDGITANIHIKWVDSIESLITVISDMSTPYTITMDNYSRTFNKFGNITHTLYPTDEIDNYCLFFTNAYV